MDELIKLDSLLSESEDYQRLKAEFQQFYEVVGRNQALFLTEELYEKAEELRKLMTLFHTQLDYAVKYDTGSNAAKVHQIDYVSKPYFKPAPSRQGLAELLTSGTKLSEELSTPILAPALAALGWTEQVENIYKLSHDALAMHQNRAEEKEFRHMVGNATKLRPSLTEILERVLYSLVEALYHLHTSGETRDLINEVIIRINGEFDTFATYVDGKTSEAGGGTLPNPEEPEDPDTEDPDTEDPDTEDPNTEDPEGPGTPPEDGGSGGPLDRDIIINIIE
jgi:hypothetical protein